MDEVRTAPTYTIRTVADFLLVPEDRIGECLREFGLMLEMARASMKLCELVADEMAKEPGSTHSPGDIRFQLVPEFEWIDDDLGNVTMSILTGPEAAPECICHGSHIPNAKDCPASATDSPATPLSVEDSNG